MIALAPDDISSGRIIFKEKRNKEIVIAIKYLIHRTAK